MKKAFQYIFNYKQFILLLFIFIFIQALSQLYLPTLMGNIVDFGVVEGNISYIVKIGIVMLLVAFGGIFASIAVSFYAAKISMSVGRDIRKDVFTRVSEFTLYEFDKIGTASLITRTTNDITQIQQALVMVLRMFLTAPFMLIGGLIMAITKDMMLTLVILVAVPIIALTMLFVLKFGFPLFRSVQLKIDHLNLVFRENLTGIRVIRSFVKEKSERFRLKQANRDLTDVSIKVNRLMAVTMPFMMFLMNGTIVLIIWVGAHRIDQGALEIGSLMAFIQYVMLIMFAIMMAAMLFVIIPRAAVSAQRIERVLTTERVEQTEGERTQIEQNVDVTFDHVHFAYPGAEQAAIRNISFTARAGETTAIIGGTGSGKTTLLQLLPRFYELDKGTVRLNSMDYTEFRLAELRKMIGYVPQNTQLFSGTIRENLRYGLDDATEEQMIKAATIAQADDFIKTLEKGYDTVLEQGGTNLSGGQRQRLAIARAIIKQRAIYLFDDSFSALDYETDRRLRTALEERTKDSTVIVVAQRVSSIIDADQIIVLDKGEIVGKGTHEELLKSNDVYKEIVSSQLGEGESA